MLAETLHKISLLKWVFLAVQIILIGYCFIYLPPNLISLIGILIYVSGIQLGLESLSDVRRMSSKDINRFREPIYFKVQSRLLLSSIVVLTLISFLFISLRFIFDSRGIFLELFSLGLNCWALILGFLCLLKYLIDKKEYVDSLPKES